MPLASPTTADHVMAAVEAVWANGGKASVAIVADFIETTAPRATAALDLAVELNLLTHAAGTYSVASPLCRFTLTPEQKTAVFRLVIEAYKPFTVFRERLVATSDVSQAARQTKTVCSLGADRDEVRDTMISLGTYSHALTTGGGGNFQLEVGSLDNMLQVLALASTDMMAAEARIRLQLGPAAEATVSRDYVIVPLADALIHAKNRDPSGAIQAAGNAVESHIDAMASAGRMNIALGSATGIISKLNRFATPRRLPAKLIHVGSYLGAIRNAADHGGDTDISGATWQIRDNTGLEYVYVACSFIATTIGIERGDPAEI